jgi:hypothetical protein
MQEHLMEEHGYTREDLQRQTSNPTNRAKNWPEVNEYTYTLPDGKDWLKAERT